MRLVEVEGMGLCVVPWSADVPVCKAVAKMKMQWVMT